MKPRRDAKYTARTWPFSTWPRLAWPLSSWRRTVGPPRSRRGCLRPPGAGIGLVALALAALSGTPAAAAARASASVGITIRVLPIAEIAFPQGTDFTITVAERSWWEGVSISPQFLPFTVRGNARASVTVRPAEFLQVGSRVYLGRAEKTGGQDSRGQGLRGQDLRGQDLRGRDWPGRDSLGYDVIVHFPVSRQRNGWFTEVDNRGYFGVLDSLATLPLFAPLGTRKLTADMVQLDRHALGVIWLQSDPDWTANGRRAAPGIYRGVLEVTVTADER